MPPPPPPPSWSPRRRGSNGRTGGAALVGCCARDGDGDDGDDDGVGEQPASDRYLRLHNELRGAVHEERYEEAAALRDEVEALRDTDPVLRLEAELRAAVSLERYERAAQLRHELTRLKLAHEASARPLFAPGAVVIHTEHSYRGVVCEHDATCARSEEWMRQHGVDTRLQRGRAQRFYTVLVDTRYRWPPETAYLAEEKLIQSDGRETVAHPLVERFFLGYREVDGAYQYMPGPELERIVQMVRDDRRDHGGGGGDDDNDDDEHFLTG